MVKCFFFYMLNLFFQKKRNIDDESNFCTEETLRDVLNSKVMHIVYYKGKAKYKIPVFRVTRPYLNLLVKPRIFISFSG